MKHQTGDIAAYIVELFERTPIKDRTLGYLDSSVERKFPGLSVEEFNAAQEIAAGIVKATRAK
jgi:hypothetical protein